MARSKETFSKKEKEKKRIKKRQDKEAKMEERKANSTKAQSLENMFAYVDENGNLSTTPPDPSKRVEVDLDSIQLGAAPERAEAETDVRRNGTILSIFQDKGFGFIRDAGDGNNVFVHVSALTYVAKPGDTVSFEVEQTPKGLAARDVRKA
jgi:cold shock CspA family protein